MGCREDRSIVQDGTCAHRQVKHIGLIGKLETFRAEGAELVNWRIFG